MSLKPISPVDAISPALERTKHLLFRPFNWSRWWRVGLLGLATGEILSSGGCNFGNLGDLGKNSGNSSVGSMGSIPGVSTTQMALIVTTLVVGIASIVLVHLYVACVLRFVLFSGTINGNYRLRQGWKHWHDKGVRYFGFQLLFTLGMLALFAPIAIAMWKAFTLGKGNIAAVIASLLVFLPVIMVLGLLAVLFQIFVKDFCIPMIALEDLKVLEAMRRVWRMIKSEAGNYAGYLLTKIVLVIVVGIALAIVQFIILLVLLIPVGIVAAVIGVGSGIDFANIFHNPMFLAAVVVGGMVLVVLMLLVMGIIAAPVAAFYQSYVLEFFGSRYLPLGELLYPAPPLPNVPSQASSNIPPDSFAPPSEEPPPIPIG